MSRTNTNIEKHEFTFRESKIMEMSARTRGKFLK